MSDEKLHVLFVDDEPKILDGLRRKMRSMRKTWEMGFASGGYEAKQMLKASHWDVIVTDMQMPGTNGQELLNIVQEKYPHMLRIVLSGYSDRELIMQTTKTAHQYLSKPTNVDTMKAAITRSVTLQKMLKEGRLIRLASQLQNIPSIPSIYNEMMQEMRKPEPTLQKIGAIIEQDPGMSAKILQIVNSAFFGTVSHVESPSRAVVMLGMDIIRGLVLSIHIFESFKENGLDERLLIRVQRHSLNVAGNAQKLASYFKLQQKQIDVTFIAGLLHDIGKLVLVSEFPQMYREIQSCAVNESKPLHETELETFHASHAELGAYLMGLWGLQEEVIEAIAFHHNPSLIHHETPVPLTCVHLANAFEYQHQGANTEGKAPEYDMEMLEQMNLSNALKKINKVMSSRT